MMGFLKTHEMEKSRVGEEQGPLMTNINEREISKWEKSNNTFILTCNAWENSDRKK